MQIAKKVLITGSNRGLGHRLAQIIATKHPEVQLHLTSRKDPQQFHQQWTRAAPHAKTNCHQMDIDDSGSIQAVVEKLKTEKAEMYRIVANAAVGFDVGLKMPSPEMAQTFIRTNFLSTIDFIKQSLPLLANDGRIVIVSAIFATLQKQPETVRKVLTNPNVTEKELIQLSEQYIDAAKRKDMKNFSLGAYGTSKALLNTWARFILPKHLKGGQGLLAMHPGWCKTDMGGPKAPMTVAQGADQIYNCLALKEVQPDKFYNQKFVSYETCQ